MATITEVRQAISDACATIVGLRSTPLITDIVNPPVAVVWRKQITFDDIQHAPGESDSPSGAEFGVTVYVQRTSERAAQDLLDGYAESSGATSVKAAIETDVALDALVSFATVTECGEVKVTTVGQVDYLTQDFTVSVFM